MAVTNSLAKRPQRVGLTAYLTDNAVKDQIAKVIGGKDGQRFISSIISAVQTTPALQECTNNSILNAALLGETLKLSPSPQLGYYYMVPFKDNKRGTVEAQFCLGYKGFIQLASRSGQYERINVVPIKQGELEAFNPLTEEIKVRLIEDEVERENTPTMGYYAMFRYLNGFEKALYWSKEKMEAHAMKYSKGYQAKKGYTFWEKDFDGMACKTMLRQLIGKWGIMSIELQQAYEADMAVINDDGSKEYVDVADINEEQTVVEEKTPENKETAPAPEDKQEEGGSIAAALFG